MLHSRAFLLLEKEFVELKQANIFGISVMPMEDNWMEWIAEIEGLKDTLWEGAPRNVIMYSGIALLTNMDELLLFTIYRAFWNSTVEFWELKSTDLKVVEVDKHCYNECMPFSRQVKQVVNEIRAKCAELQLSLKYFEDYNVMPPTITFTTIPFHPNVDPESGRPCVDFLDNLSKWNTNFTMTSILLTIQVLLSNPVLDNAVNLEAAQMLRNNYPLYREKVVQCVTNSKQLEAIAKDWDTSVKFVQKSPEPTPHRKTKAISYEEYFITWFKIATSRPAQDFKHPVFEDPEYIGNRYHWMAENVNRGSWDENLHNIFVSECIEKQKKQIKLENWGGRCIIPSPEPSKTSSVEPKKIDKSKNEEQWEDEVEGLVVWSTKLDQGKLD